MITFPVGSSRLRGSRSKLAVTIGAILTLFVVMQMTGRLKWEEKFGPALAGNGRVMT